MSTDTGAPLHLEYLDPSQAQPEVKINAAWDAINSHVGGGSDSSDTGSPLTVSDGTTIVTDVIEVIFSQSGSVHDSGGGVVHVDNAGGGGSDSSDSGSSLEVSDGSTTVSGVTEIVFTGATVAASGTTAEVSITGGGGSSPYNVTPLTHDSGVPAFVSSDDFEQSNGTAVDTTGGRFSGAAAWTWLNQGAASAVQQNGSLVITPDSSTPRHNFLQQPVNGSTWTIQCQIATFNASSADGGGIFVRDSVSGKIIAFFTYYSSNVYIQALTSPSSLNTTLGNAGPAMPALGTDVYPLWLQITWDGTTLSFNYSQSGIPGTFHVVTTDSSFLGTAPTHWGILSNGIGSSSARILFDKFEQIA